MVDSTPGADEIARKEKELLLETAARTKPGDDHAAAQQQKLQARGKQQKLQGARGYRGKFHGKGKGKHKKRISHQNK
jgi:hypothetical protein